MTRRLPARLRIAGALLIAVSAHAFLAAEADALRLRLLPGIPVLGSLGGPPAAAPDDALEAHVAAWRRARADALAAAGQAAVPVLFFRPRDRVAVIGAGLTSGLDVRAAVEAPAGLLGLIDAAEPHVARVRLLSSPRSRVPVRAAESRPGLPGDVTTLNAVLEGMGEDARLVSGALLTEFREGDRLTTAATERPIAVGVVTAAGPEPRVQLAAGPGDLGLVAVAAGSAPPQALFRDARARVRIAALLGGGGALLVAPTAEGVTPGCLVHDHGRYLGRVASVAKDSVLASRLDDRGHRVFVRCLGPGGATWTGELVSVGAGAFRLDVPGLDAAVHELIAVTAGGQDLVPAFVRVGVLRRDGALWRMPDAGARWPDAVDVSVFQFHDEIRKLIGP